MELDKKTEERKEPKVRRKKLKEDKGEVWKNILIKFKKE